MACQNVPFHITITSIKSIEVQKMITNQLWITPKNIDNKKTVERNMIKGL